VLFWRIVILKGSPSLKQTILVPIGDYFEKRKYIKKRKNQEINSVLGLRSTAICTPEELIGGLYE